MLFSHFGALQTCRVKWNPRVHTQKHTSAKHTHKHDPTEPWQTLTTAHANGWEWDDVRKCLNQTRALTHGTHTPHTHIIFKKFEDMMMSPSNQARNMWITFDLYTYPRVKTLSVPVRSEGSLSKNTLLVIGN